MAGGEEVNGEEVVEADAEEGKSQRSCLGALSHLYRNDRHGCGCMPIAAMIDVGYVRLRSTTHPSASSPWVPARSVAPQTPV